MHGGFERRIFDQFLDKIWFELVHCTVNTEHASYLSLIFDEDFSAQNKNHKRSSWGPLQSCVCVCVRSVFLLLLWIPLFLSQNICLNHTIEYIYESNVMVIMSMIYMRGWELIGWLRECSAAQILPFCILIVRRKRDRIDKVFYIFRTQINIIVIIIINVFWHNILIECIKCYAMKKHSTVDQIKWFLCFAAQNIHHKRVS